MPPSHRSPRSPLPLLVLGGLVAVIVIGGVVGISLSGSGKATAVTTTSTTTAPPTTTPPTTTTTIDPGTLPQTAAEPSALDPGFQARMAAVLAAISTGNPNLAHPGFFPLAAYLQTKSGGGNDQDWHFRLLSNFDRDVRLLHQRLDPTGGHLVFVRAGTTQPSAWITPGMEENKGPYWRTLSTTITYRFTPSGPLRVQTVLCCISWRGQWYPIHLLSFT